MKRRDTAGITEGLVSIGALLLVLLPALTLVFFGKMQGASSDNAIQVNAATAEDFAKALSIEPEISTRLKDYRTARGGFESTDALLDLPLLSATERKTVLAQIRKTPVSESSFKTSDARRLSQELKLPLPFAKRLAAFRDSRPVLNPVSERGFNGHSSNRIDTSELLLKSATLLDSNATRPLLKRFAVRSATTVKLHFWVCVGLLSAAVLLLPALLRMKGGGGDPWLVPATLLLCGLGVVVLFSVKDPFRDRAVYEHHLWGMLPALFALVIGAKLRASARARIPRYLYLWIIGSLALAGALFIFGSGPEGVKLNLFHFQPVEIIKLFLIFFLAGYLSDRADLIADTSSKGLVPEANAKFAFRRIFALPRKQDMGPVVVMFAMALLLFVIIKDMGPGLVIFAAFIVTLSLTTGRGSFLFAGLLLMIGGGFLGYFLHIGVFATRVDMWLHPFSNSHPNGLQLGQSLWAASTGGWAGSGPGLGMPSLVPRSGSDLAFASWIEETGLAGAFLVLLLFSLMVWRGVIIGVRASSAFDRSLAFSLTTLLGLQALLIIAGVTGAFPLSGISLPFMSYGNSALIVNCLIVGLLQGISRSNRGSDASPQLRPKIAKAAKAFSFAYAILLIVGIGGFKLAPLMTWQADKIALQTVSTPDADGVNRPHSNPRLQFMERQIDRGSIYDAKGLTVATSRYDEILKAGGSPALARKIADSHRRFYPFGPALAHLVGYSDSSVGGPFGLERTYQNDLRGWKEASELLKDYRERWQFGFQPRHGSDLTLTIDAALQQKAQELLLRTASSFKDKKTGKPKDRAAFVMSHPETGDILIAVSIPSFDPNSLTPEKMKSLATGELANAEHVLVNRALSGLYPPGSTLKTATTAYALDSLPNAQTTSFNCNRISPVLKWRANGERYTHRPVRDDAGDPNFGALQLRQAFTVSSNIYFANLAINLDSTGFRDLLSARLGFRHVPKQSLFDADLPEIGFGQGRMLATPLEMCRLSATITNDGIGMTPRIVKLITPRRSNGNVVESVKTREIPATTTGVAFKPNSAVILRGMMRSVVTSGTARGVFDNLPFNVAGKTGTAQNSQFDGEPHSWFIGFAPYDENRASPAKVAFSCVIENGGYGKKGAAVVCMDVLAATFK